MRKKYLHIWLFFCVCSLSALPPPVPSAGVVERELEKEYEGKPLEIDKQIPAIQIDIPKEQLMLPHGRQVLIHNVEIVGNESIATRKIKRWIRSYLHKKLSMEEIHQICTIIERHYVKEGYFLARAYPPPQTIHDHVLQIRILEGKLGTVKVVGNKYYTKQFILSYFKKLQDKPLNYNAFLRALMLLNDHSDLRIGALFEKGKEFGYADVILRVNDARPAHLYLNGNNYGRNLTTDARVGGRIDFGNFLVQGDLVSVAEVVGFPVDALYFTDATYTFPINRNGTFLELAYLYSRFKIEELTSLHLKGSSAIATLKGNHALIRTRSLDVDLFGYFDYKQIQNFVLGHRSSFDRLRVVTVGTLLDHFSPGQGRDYLTLSFAAGIPDFLGGLKPIGSHCSRKGGGGRFFMFNIDYDRLQHLSNNCYLHVHASGQLSPSKLTLPEQIYIGGSDTVRGFPLAVALGDSGYYVNVELRVPPPFFGNERFFGSRKKWKEIVQFDAFVDNGGTFLQSLSNTFLWGTGVGIRINGPWRLAVSADVGFALNHRSLTNGAFYYLKVTGQPF